jgi:hypothetical protein
VPTPGSPQPAPSDIEAIRDAHLKEINSGRFAVIALSIEEKLNLTKTQAEKEKLDFAVAWLGDAADGQIYDTWNLRSLPTAYLVGPDGKLIARDATTNELKAAVDRMLKKE